MMTDLKSSDKLLTVSILTCKENKKNKNLVQADITNKLYVCLNP